MPNQHSNENLATLLEPDIEDIVQELDLRIQQGISYIPFGDGIIAIDTHKKVNSPENSPANGWKYCSMRPAQNLPTHLFGLAHSIYTDVTSPSSIPQSHSIFISGVCDSGKSEVSELLLAQFGREAKVHEGHKVTNHLSKGMSVLKRLLTRKIPTGRTLNTTAVVTSLYFGRHGQISTGKLRLHLLRPRCVVPCRPTGCHLDIFYDLSAALLSGEPGLPIEGNIQRILQSVDPTLLNLSPELLAHHRRCWQFFVGMLGDLKLNQSVSEYIPLEESFGTSSTTVVEYLVGLFLLACMKFDVEQHTRNYQFLTDGTFVKAANLLGVSDRALYNCLFVTAANGNELPLADAVQSRDQLVYDLYSCLIHKLTEDINRGLPDVTETDTCVHLVDLPSFVDEPSGSLEDLCHNTAAEYLQMLLNTAIFVRENEARQTEGLRTTEIKRQQCDEIVNLALASPGGLFHRLETMCKNSSETNKSLARSLDKDFKKRKTLYLSSKVVGKEKFSIVHSHQQVEYTVNDLFRHQSQIFPNREAQTLLASSSNMMVNKSFKSLLHELSTKNARFPVSYISHVMAEVFSLRDEVFQSTPHLIRCIKTSTSASEPDAHLNFLKYQIRPSCLSDILHQKKFGYTRWIPVPDFIQRYKVLDFSLLIRSMEPAEACQRVLEAAGVWNRGPVVTSRCVFLGYWHKQKLDSMVQTQVWRVVKAQAEVRGLLARRKVRELLAARSIETQQAEQAENDLFENMIVKTLSRVGDLPSSVWAKVVYLEHDKPMAKVYAAELTFLVTGSQESFDGIELGLSHFLSQNSPLETANITYCLNQGIELRRDSDGSLQVKKHCQLPVYVKLQRGQPQLSEDLIKSQGELPHNQFITIFNMTEFESLISLEMRKPYFRPAKLRKWCVTVLRFGDSDLPFLKLPCWIAVINIHALNMLDDDQELQSLALLTSHMALIQGETNSKTKAEHEEAKKRRQRQHWSKSDQRPMPNTKKADGRKIREELRSRGERVSDYMKYSWEEEVVHKSTINMDQLHEKMRQQSSTLTSAFSNGTGKASPARNWAKVNVALRQATRELQKVEVEETKMKEHQSL